MNLTEFKKLYKNASQEEKLGLLCDSLWNSGTARVNSEIAKALRNQKDYKYWINENKAMMARSDWLYKDILAHIKLYEKSDKNAV